MTDETKDPAVPPDLAASFQELKLVAHELNAASDVLAGPIATLDEAIKRLNIGLRAWKQFDGGFDEEDGTYWAEEIGYTKIDSKWGIALMRRIGDAINPDAEQFEAWLFNDAPRTLRLKAVEHLPKVFEALIEKARENAAEIT